MRVHQVHLLWRGLAGRALTFRRRLPRQPSPSKARPAIRFRLRELSSSFESLAGRVRPAVVQIFSTGYATAEEGAGTNTASLLSTERSTGSGCDPLAGRLHHHQ